jgi:hypothetical protein
MTPAEEMCRRLVSREGGIKDVGDGMGVTYFGQTLQWLNDLGLNPPQTGEQAVSNYSVWMAKTGIDFVFGPTLDDLADFVIDFAIKSSNHTSIARLQYALKITSDGVIGPKTRAAVAACDRRQIAREVLAAGLEYEGALIEKDPGKFARYALGWARRRADMIRRIA